MGLMAPKILTCTTNYGNYSFITLFKKINTFFKTCDMSDSFSVNTI